MVPGHGAGAPASGGVARLTPQEEVKQRLTTVPRPQAPAPLPVPQALAVPATHHIPFPEVRIGKRDFFQINCDNALTSSGHEGSALWYTSEMLVKYLDAFAPFDPDSVEAKRLLVQLQDERLYTNYSSHAQVATEATRLCGNIAALGEGKRLVISGGHLKKPVGHAMVYEVIKKGANSYDFFVYNTSGGLKYQTTTVSGIKSKMNPVLGFENLTLEDLSTDFIETLLLPQTKLVGDTFVMDSLFRAIYAHLGHKVKPDTLDLSEYITTQRSGTCALKAPLALLRRVLGRHKYKEFVYKMSYDSLLAANHGCVDLSDKKERNLVANAARNLMHMSCKLGGIPNEEGIALARATLEQVAHYEEIKKFRNVCDLSTRAVNHPRVVVDRPSSYYPTIFPKSFYTGYSAKEALRAISRLNGAEKRAQIELFVDKLDIESCDPIDSSDAQNYYELLRGYERALDTSQLGLTARQRNTLHTLFIFIYKHCKQYDSRLAECFGAAGLLNHDDPAQLFLSTDELRRQATIAAFYQRELPKKTITGYKISLANFNASNSGALVAYAWDQYQSIKGRVTAEKDAYYDEKPAFYRPQSRTPRNKVYYDFAERFGDFDEPISSNGEVSKTFRRMQKAMTLMQGTELKKHTNRYDNKSSQDVYECYVGKQTHDPLKLVSYDLIDRTLARNTRVPPEWVAEVEREDRTQLAASPQTAQIKRLFFRHALGHTRLAPIDIFHHCSRFFSELNLPEVRSLIEHQLFKSIEGEAPLHGAIHDPLFEKAVLDFLDRSIKVFALGIDDSGVDRALFLIRLAGHLTNLPEIRRSDFARKLQERVQKLAAEFKLETLSELSQAKFHLHMALYLSADFTERTFPHVASWLGFVKVEALLGNIGELKGMIQIVKQRFLPELERRFDGEDELSRYLFGEPCDECIRDGSVLTFYRNGRREKAQVDLFSGRMLTYQGVAPQLIDIDKLMASDPFKEIFPDPSKITFRSGISHLFVETSSGKYRISASSEDKFKIEREFHDLWLQEIEVKELIDLYQIKLQAGKLQSNIPPHILAACNVFSNENSLYFFDKMSGDLLFRSTSYEGLTRASNRSGVLKTEPDSAFRMIENSNFIDVIDNQVHFPRYQNLYFTQERGEWVWNHDSSYRLVEQTDTSTLGDFHNFLLLKSSNAKAPDLALVPDIDVAGDGLDLLGFKGNDVKAALSSVKIGEREVFAIPLKDGKFAPSNAQQYIVAAYIELLKGNFLEALGYIENVSRLDLGRSEKCVKLLHRFLSVAAGSSHPEVLGLFMREKYLLMRHSELTEKKIAPKESEYLLYLERLGNIPYAYRLTHEQELWFINKSKSGNRRIENRRRLLAGEACLPMVIGREMPKNATVTLPRDDEVVTQFDPDTPAPIALRDLSLTEMIDYLKNYSTEDKGEFYAYIMKAKRNRFEREKARKNLQTIALYGTNENKLAAFYLKILESDNTTFPWTFTLSQRQRDEIRRNSGNSWYESCYKEQSFKDWRRALCAAHGVSFSKEVTVWSPSDRSGDPMPEHPDLSGEPLHNPPNFRRVQDSLQLSAPLNSTPYTATLETVKTQILSSKLPPVDRTDYTADLNRMHSPSEEWKDAYDATMAEFMKGYAKTLAAREGLPSHKPHVDQPDVSHLVTMEQDLLALANPTALEHDVRLHGGGAKALTINDLVYLFFEGNRSAYPQGVNADHLYDATAQYMRAAIEYQQSMRLYEKTDLLELREIAKQTSQYDVISDPERLVFEYMMHVMLRSNPDQAKTLKFILENLQQKKNCTVQVPMGGGKTSVVATYFLAKMAGKDKLPILLTPSFQYQTISETLQQNLKQAFGIEVMTLNLHREELDLNRIRAVKSLLEEVQKGSQFGTPRVLVACPEGLQVLELEFLALMRELKRFRNAIPHDLSAKIEELRGILKLLRDKGVALCDEVHQVLNINMEMNFPLGETTHPDKENVSLVAEIMKELFKPDVRRALHIDTNEQKKYFDREYFMKTVVPRVAERLSRLDILEIQEEEDRVELLKFIKGLIPASVQNAYDSGDPVSPEHQSAYEFLKFLDTDMHNSDVDEEKKAADLISLSKHLLMNLVPYILNNKTANTHFGRSKDPKTPGKVVPYITSKTPSNNEFGNIYEAMIYHFMTAMTYGVEKAQVEMVLKEYEEEAKWFMVNRAMAYEDTPPMREFQAIFGFLPANLTIDKIMETIQDSSRALFAIEAKTISKYVENSPIRLNSNAMSIVSMLGNFVGMSGTPNVNLLHHSLQENTQLDSTVNPTVMHALLRKQVLQRMISGDLIDDSVQGVNGIIDVGSHFKDIPNIEVANRIFAARPDIDNIVFYTRHNGSTTADYPAILRRGETHPEILPDLTKDTLRQHGLEAGDFFLFLDKRHSEGTDVPALPDARYSLIWGTDTSLNSGSQAIMRLRQFAHNQEVVICLPEKDAALMKLDGLVHEINLKLVSLMIAEQARETGSKMVKSFKKMLVNSVVQAGKEAALQGSLLQASKELEKYEEYIYLDNEDRPYDAYASLEVPIDTLKVLKDLSAKLVRKFPSIAQEHAKILQLAETKAKFFQKEVMRSLRELNEAARDDGTEVENQVEVQVQQEKQLEVEKEVEDELELMQRPQAETERRYPTIDAQAFMNEEQTKWKEATTSVPMRDALSEKWFNFGSGYQNPYGLAFEKGGLRVTPEYLRPYVEDVSFFNRSMPPAKYMMVFKSPGGEYKGVVVSQRQAAELKTHPREDVWLIMPNRELHAGDPEKLNFEDEKLAQLMLEFNVLTGNFDYCFRNLKDYADWLEYDERGQAIAMKERYLKLLYVKYPQLQNNAYLKLVDLKCVKRMILREERAELFTGDGDDMDLSVIAAFTEADRATTPLLSTSAQVKALPANLVKYLTATQMRFVSKEQAPHISDPALIKRIKPRVIGRLKMSSLTPGFVNALTDRQLGYITDPAIIQHLPRAKHLLVNPRLTPHIPNAVELFNLISDEHLLYASPDQLRTWFAQPGSTERMQKIIFTRALEKMIDFGFTDVTKSQLQSLSEPYLAKLPNSKVHLLGPIKVGRLKTEAVISKLGPHQANFVKQPNALNRGAIKGLTKENLVRSLRFNKLLSVNPNQLHMVSPVRRLAYVVTSIAAAIFSLIAIIFTEFFFAITMPLKLHAAREARDFVREGLIRFGNLLAYPFIGTPRARPIPYPA
ncbi:MAG: DUF3638 domain-containing protein [Simkaniaceae bacterium]|nr:DUF3638 domain-containing protein [Simkaniaceae bacterium]